MESHVASQEPDGFVTSTVPVIARNSRFLEPTTTAQCWCAVELSPCCPFAHFRSAYRDRRSVERDRIAGAIGTGSADRPSDGARPIAWTATYEQVVESIFTVFTSNVVCGLVEPALVGLGVSFELPISVAFSCHVVPVTSTLCPTCPSRLSPFNVVRRACRIRRRLVDTGRACGARRRRLLRSEHGVGEHVVSGVGALGDTSRNGDRTVHARLIRFVLVHRDCLCRERHRYIPPRSRRLLHTSFDSCCLPLKVTDLILLPAET